MSKDTPMAEMSVGRAYTVGGDRRHRPTRLSIYFDYGDDNHHMELENQTPRGTVVKLLRELADLIEKEGERRG